MMGDVREPLDTTDWTIANWTLWALWMLVRVPVVLVIMVVGWTLALAVVLIWMIVDPTGDGPPA